jgi:hypothetical protein
VPCSSPEVLWKLSCCSRKNDVCQPEVDEHVVVPQELVQYLYNWSEFQAVINRGYVKAWTA